jgi:hypothetical protein
MARLKPCPFKRIGLKGLKKVAVELGFRGIRRCSGIMLGGEYARNWRGWSAVLQEI